MTFHTTARLLITIIYNSILHEFMWFTKISILKVVSTLTIGKVRYMDMGHYRCLADNTETAVAHSQYAELSITRTFTHS